jgi:hypothetical protein
MSLRLFEFRLDHYSAISIKLLGETEIRRAFMCESRWLTKWIATAGGFPPQQARLRR